MTAPTPFDTDFVVLAGGRGTRATHLPPGTPKFLTPHPAARGGTVGGELLACLEDRGARRALLLLGYGAEAVRYASLGELDDLDVVSLVEDEPRGTVASLRLALPYVRSDWLVVVNGDTLLNIDPGSILARAREGVLWSVQGIDFLSEEPSVPTGMRVLSREAACKLVTNLNGFATNLENPLAGWRPYLTNRKFLDVGTPEGFAALDAWFAVLGGKKVTPRRAKR